MSATAEIMYTPLDLRFAAIGYRHQLTVYLAIGSLHLVEQRHPRILVVQPRQFPHDLAAALVLQMRHHHFDRDNLVTPLARMRSTFHTALAHAQLLTALRAWRP